MPTIPPYLRHSRLVSAQPEKRAILFASQCSCFARGKGGMVFWMSIFKPIWSHLFGNSSGRTFRDIWKIHSVPTQLLESKLKLWMEVSKQFLVWLCGCSRTLAEVQILESQSCCASSKFQVLLVQCLPQRSFPCFEERCCSQPSGRSSTVGLSQKKTSTQST